MSVSPTFRIATSFVYLVVVARYLPKSRMILLVTADGREMSFARHVVARAGLPNVSGVDGQGVTYAPPLVMIVTRQGYLYSIVAQVSPDEA